MNWWQRLWHRDKLDQQLDRELGFHMEQHTADLIRQGYTPEEAARQARLALGGLEQVKEVCRDARGTRWLEDFQQDLLYAVRSFRRSPAFTLTAVLTLGLGIGATTAIFSVADGVLLRPFAVREPDRLFVIHESVPKFSHLAPLIPVAAGHYLEWQRSCRSFEGLALFRTGTASLTGDGEPILLAAGRASASLWPLLGVAPQLGRAFTVSEDRPGHENVVIIGDSLWRRRFGGDPLVLGRSIVLSGKTHEVIGVLPALFPLSRVDALSPLPTSAETIDIWTPIALEESKLATFGDFNYTVLARLAPGLTRDQALSELNVVQNRISTQLPDRLELHAHLVAIGDQIAGRHKQGLWLLLAAVGFVLLIGCVNIANLLLVRSTARWRELALRAALGAGRGRLFRQALAESWLLAIVGGTLGVAIGSVLLQGFLTAAPVDLPRMEGIRLDGRVLAFAAVLTGVASNLAGLLPAWRSSRLESQEALRGGGRTATETRSMGRWRSVLVGAEVALSAACLVVAALLLQSFSRVLSVHPGFSAENVLTAKITLMGARYSSHERRASFLREALQKAASVPGVVASGLANLMPLAADHNNNLVRAEGSNTRIGEMPVAEQRFVNAGYFRALGIPLVAGRVFDESDRERLVAMVSKRTAERLWPAENAVGKRVQLGPLDALPWEVVGVVGEVHDAALDKPPNFAIYVPYWLRTYNTMILAVRATGDPRMLAGDVRRVLRDLDPELPLPALNTLAGTAQATVAARRFQLSLVLGFAIAALLLASLGIYGVLAYSVGLRRVELGIRLALGARPAAVRDLVLRQGLTPVFWGFAGGAIGGVAGARLIRALLFGIGPGDATTIAAVASVLFIVAAAACWIPATRAARLDPLIALRYE